MYYQAEIPSICYTIVIPQATEVTLTNLLKRLLKVFDEDLEQL